MDEYRQSVLGRALADVLQDLEGGGDLDAAAGDALFALFDAAAREQLSETPATHETLALRAQTDTYNRFLDKWSLAVTLPPGEEQGGDSALTMDGASWPLPRTCTHMLVKLHTPPPPPRYPKRSKNSRT